MRVTTFAVLAALLACSARVHAAGSFEYWPGVCGTGRSQSPVDFSLKDVQRGAPEADTMDFSGYQKATGVEVHHLGNTIKVIPATGALGSMQFNGATCTVKEFHFHEHSEHTVDTQPYDMEMHIVHECAGGEFFAVAGFFFVQGQESAFLNSLGWDALPQLNTNVTTSGEIDLSQLSGSMGQPYFGYSGSLTTPPCTEGVIFRIMQRNQEMSAAQLTAIRALFSENADYFGRGNYRNIQPLNGRIVTLYGATGTDGAEPSITEVGEVPCDVDESTVSIVGTALTGVVLLVLLVHVGRHWSAAGGTPAKTSSSSVQM